MPLKKEYKQLLKTKTIEWVKGSVVEISIWCEINMIIHYCHGILYVAFG